ncbi:MAG: RIP metalloprotease RseP [Candidatus Gastranaerophilales bacterium]|nr:RIP metalloprotease RseP [Candidatus Gastranaerophilales bacterium]
MILLISFLVMVHELGHFFVAKAFKIRVDKFGFGLPVGPTLFRKKIGETEFLIHALLLGGYVSFPDDDAESKIPKDSPERFVNKPAYQRFFVVVAGVTANFITAILLVMLTAGIWHKLPTNTFETSFDELLPTATPSVKAAGLQKGDVFYEINGSNVDLPNVLSQYLYLSRSFDGYTSQRLVNKKLTELKALNPTINPDKVIAKGTVIELPAEEDEPPVHLTSDQLIGFERYKSNEIPLTDMQKAVRDNIQGVKYYTIKIPTTFEDLAFSLADTRKPVEITVLRDGKKVDLPVIYPDRDGMMGIKKNVTEVMYPVKTLKDNIEATYHYVKLNSELMLYGLGKMFAGKIPMEEMHGIVAVTKIGSDIIEYHGFFKGLLLTAIISLNLAYLNLLPIPALDGGHVLFLCIEKLMGKPVNEKVTEIVSNLFFYLLIIFMIYIIYNDIIALVTNKI